LLFEILQFIKYILICSFLLQSSSKTGIYLSFLKNKDFISKNICVQKTIKKNKCNGKCHLKKQMKKDDTAQNEKSDSKKEKSEINFSSNSIISCLELIRQQSIIIYLEEKSFSLQQHYSKILRPPTA
jgi:hypothetical protein